MMIATSLEGSIERVMKFPARVASGSRKIITDIPLIGNPLDRPTIMCPASCGIASFSKSVRSMFSILRMGLADSLRLTVSSLMSVQCGE